MHHSHIKLKILSVLWHKNYLNIPILTTLNICLISANIYAHPFMKYFRAGYWIKRIWRVVRYWKGPVAMHKQCPLIFPTYVDPQWHNTADVVFFQILPDLCFLFTQWQWSIQNKQRALIQGFPKYSDASWCARRTFLMCARGFSN